MLEIEESFGCILSTIKRSSHNAIMSLLLWKIQQNETNSTTGRMCMTSSSQGVHQGTKYKF